MPVRTSNKTLERPVPVSPAGRTGIVPSSGDEIRNVTSTSVAVQGNCIVPCEPLPDPKRPAAGETTVIIHEDEAGEILSSITAYQRSSGIVHRAMKVLEEWKFRPARIVSSLTPVDIIAFRGEEALLVQVIAAKTPVPDAKTAESRYKEKIVSLRQMGTDRQFRKVVMVYSQKCGWKYYDVLPGGLIPAWSLAEVPKK